MRKAIVIFLFCIFWMQPAFPLSQSLQYQDISRVMDRFFTFHIENKKLNTTIVRRSMKLYIEHFDPEKAYLLESEAGPYLAISDKKALEILARLERRDYSDFFALNGLIQQSIVRAQAARGFVAKELVHAMEETEATRPFVFQGFAIGSGPLTIG